MWSVCTVGRRRQNQLISRGDCLEVLTTVMIFDRRRRSQRRSHARFFYSRPLFKVEPAASRFFGNLCDRYIFSLLHKTKTLKPVSNQIKTRNVQRTPKKLNRAMAGQLSLLARFSFSFSISFANQQMKSKRKTETGQQRNPVIGSCVREISPTETCRLWCVAAWYKWRKRLSA